MTLAEIRTFVRARLGVPANDTRRLPAVIIDGYANDVCKSLATRRNWPFLLTFADPDTLTGGEWNPALPADFCRPFEVLLQDTAGGNPRPLAAASYEDIVADSPNPTDASTWSTPRTAALVGRTSIALWPPPAVGVKLFVHYYKFPAALVEDDDDNEMTTNLDLAVKWLTAGECADYDHQADISAEAHGKGERYFREVYYDLADAARLNQQPVIEEP